LQANGFTTRTILYPEDKANDDSEIRVSNLTNEGFDFFNMELLDGERNWIGQKI